MMRAQAVLQWRARLWLALAVMAPAISGFGAAQPKYEVLKAFGAFNGKQPTGRLVQGTDGAFYGTTYGGGTRGDWGTVFRVSSDGSNFTVIHSFVKDDGASPTAGLVEGSDGFFYGTTYFGGQYDLGTVFKMAADGSNFSVLRSFSGPDGANPYAELIQLSDGAFYATTVNGGTWGMGTIFRISSDGSSFSILHHLTPRSLNGAHPNSKLVLRQIQASMERPFGSCGHGTVSGSTGWILSRVTSSTRRLASRMPVHRGPTERCTERPRVAAIRAPGHCSGSWSQDLRSRSSITSTPPSVRLLRKAWSWARMDTSTARQDTAPPTVGRSSRFRRMDPRLPRSSLRREGGPALPSGALEESTDGMLYGVTLGGGRSGAGTIFKMAADNSSFASVFSFDNDGLGTTSGLVVGADGALYGTNSTGGAARIGA
jgi:uncharacterized repeat protein (TIGR03803 family)